MHISIQTETSDRWINSLNQDLPPTKEWDEFLINHKNKLQIVNLLVDYIKSDRNYIRFHLNF